MALLIDTDGKIREVVPSNPKKGFSLDELKYLIGGGWIEHVSSPLGSIDAIVDEEGKLKGMDYNLLATVILGMESRGDVIAGPCVIFTHKGEWR